MQLQLRKNKYEFELAKLKENKAIKAEVQGHFISSTSKFVPKFQDEDLNAYFLAFEKTATLMKLPKENWSMLLLLSESRRLCLLRPRYLS